MPTKVLCVACEFRFDCTRPITPRHINDKSKAKITLLALVVVAMVGTVVDAFCCLQTTKTARTTTTTRNVGDLFQYRAHMINFHPLSPLS